MKYSPAVLERVRDPKYVGWLPRDAPDVGTGEAGTLERGTMTRIQVRVDGGTATHRRRRCSRCSAAARRLRARAWWPNGLRGARLDDVRTMESLAMVAELELPIERAGVAALAVEAARHAIEDWERET